MPKKMLSCQDPNDDVLFETKSSTGIITLNRPRALNALNENMIRKIFETIKKWQCSRTHVVVKSSSSKAFCAGGDVIAVTKGGPLKSQLGKDFFRLEYTMNHLIGKYAIPYISFIDGIAMGGGVGLSVHGRYRIATDRSIFAMPETAIGFFPDVGASYILSRLKGKLGFYLGMTGHRLKGKDLVKAGIATHYCNPSEKLTCVLKNIINITDCQKGQEDELLTEWTDSIFEHAFSLAPHLASIDDIFAAPSVKEIFERLEKTDSCWAKETLEVMKKMSPLSLEITRQELQNSEKLELDECLKMEYRICCHILDGKISTDFYEGVRALLVDKDKKPKWNPPTIEKVTKEMVDEYFALLPKDKELDL